MAATANTVSTTQAPSPAMKPALWPPLKDFWMTRIAIGPIGAEAQMPTIKAFMMSSSIDQGSKIIQTNKDK
jgi:hypothetical protein